MKRRRDEKVTLNVLNKNTDTYMRYNRAIRQFFLVVLLACFYVYISFIYLFFS